MEKDGKSNRWLIVAATLLLAVFGAPSVGGTTDWKDSPFGYLARHAGTSEIWKFLDEPHIAEQMSELLGDKVALLKLNIRVTGPIDMVVKHVVASGARPHEAHLESAAVAVDMHDGDVHVGIKNQGHRASLYEKDQI